MAQRFEGKNLEEALAAAGAGLGVERFRLKYRVLSEKRGFLGGVKRIVVEAEVDPNASAPVVTTPPVLSQELVEAARVVGDRPRERSGARPRGRTQREERPREPRRQVADRFGEEMPEQASRSPFATQVVDWLTELSTHADFEIEFRSFETPDQLTVRIYGRDARRFVDRDAELLDAVQTLIGRAFRESEKPIEVDALSFKQQRNEELIEKAMKLADRVRRERSEQQLPAMSPVERRIVHVALAADPDVTTESRGEGYMKRVTIMPRPTAES